MWDNLKIIYGGDDNVLNAKLESPRVNFGEMKMIEVENIVQYCTRIKEVVNTITRDNRKIEDETIISKDLRTLLPIYLIKVFVIQELRCTLGDNLTQEGIIDRLSTFEMSIFYNYTTNTIEYAFK